MKIAHCIHGLGIGGAQQIIKYIVGAGDRDAFTHLVYSPSDGVFRRDIEEAGATVRIIRRVLPKFDPFWVAALARAMRDDGIDVVHAHLFGDSLHAYLAARRAGRLPVVVTLHNTAESHTAVQRWGYRWLLTRTTRNVACCDSVRTSFMALGRGRPLDVYTIANGIDSVLVPAGAARNGLRQSLGVDRDARLIGAVGRLVEQKGFDALIRAVAALVRRTRVEIRLAIVGDGPLRATLEAEAVRAGVAPLVRFAGFRRDVRALYQAFDVVAFTSRFEGLPMAVLEAMAASRCIVTFDVPGITEVLTHEETALIAPSGDEDAMAYAIARVIDDDALAHRLGDAARRRVVADFSAERMVARYEQLYKEM